MCALHHFWHDDFRHSNSPLEADISTDRVTPGLGHTSRCGYPTCNILKSIDFLHPEEIIVFFLFERLPDSSMRSDNAEKIFEKPVLSDTDTQPINIQLDSGNQHVKYRRKIWQLWCVFFLTMNTI